MSLKAGQLPKERVLHLADIIAPKMKTSTTDEEDWAFESRDFLRSLTIGKEITFTSTHSVSSSADNVRDIGTAEINGLDISIEILKNGWAKLKELKREPTEEDLKKREAEAEAKNDGKGIWNPDGPQARTVEYNMPVDSQAFMTTWKGKPIDAIVENVRDGSTVRVRLFLSDNEHQFVNVAMAGVRTPRASNKQGEPSEQWGEEAKYFTESRMLQRLVKVTLLSLPQLTATPFQAGSSSAPPPAMILIGNVIHPVGNIAEHLVAAGLARVVDWHAGILASSGGMERLRAAEKAAKEKRLYLYANLPTSAASKTNEHSAGGSPRNFDGTVIRVWSGDQLSIVDKEGKERKVQLSSTRAPKQSDPKQAHYANEAREFLRKKLIGKHVKVTIDFIRPKEGEFEERECATVRYANHNTNVAEQLIDKGLAGVVRHKRDDEDRSPDFDKLVAAEHAAASEQRGIHSQKEVQPPKPPSNISESSHRATSFLNSFKRQGRTPGVVEYVAAGSRFKVFLPRDNQVLTLVLGGIRAPRTARNSSEKGEPYGVEAAEFATRRYMQRDVEIEIETVDKSGGFIGTLWLNKNENAAIALVQEGLATVHSYSADTLSWARQLYAAEAEAKEKKLNIWKDYDEEAEKAVQPVEEGDPTALKAEYIDVIISDTRTTNGLAFSVQILNTKEIESLEQLAKDLSSHHRTARPAPAGFSPKPGDLVAAKFSDGEWYRAKVRKSSAVKKEAQVTFIDYGNQDTVGFKDIRPLEEKFRSLPGQAHDARMSFVKLVAPESEYFTEAVERFKQLCDGRRLIANVDHREGPLLHLRLIDSAKPDVASDPNACINLDLVAEGLASVDRKGCKYLNAYPVVAKKLQEAVSEAKKQRQGMFEFGDVEEDD
ncbi:transcription factor [Thelephora terrestris]|uniref:Transcription factor n=1 Tax=Thelephora terrestris TaxID=56493 RepID=A0A9P6LDW9_9AGAM|nr:transcription factor [Thelephora terrestris]